MEGRTTREIAQAIEKATEGMNHFVAKIGNAAFVIRGVVWTPVSANDTDHSISADPISSQSDEFRITRKATPEEQKLVDQVKWIRQ